MKPEEAIASLNSLFPDSKYKFIQKVERWHENGIHEIEYVVNICTPTGVTSIKTQTLQELMRKIKETKQ